VRAQRTIEVLEALVGFDTTSRNSNIPLVEWVEAYLDRLGVAHERVPDKTGGKANVWATIGPADVPGIILSGHTDVVPVDGQSWLSDPFRLTERNGRLYGRGATDMKGFDACCLAAVPDMVAAPLTRPIHLALSYDEEVGCIGVRGMIERLERAKVKPAACFVGEPTEMRVVIGHKGKRSFRVTMHGKTCHSSLAPRGVNAVEYAARLIVKIRDISDRLARSGAHDPLYDVPYTTAHTGVVHGGIALNIVPDACTFEFEFRPLATDDLGSLVDEVMAHARAARTGDARGRSGSSHRIRRDIGVPWAGNARFARRRRPGETARRTQRARQGCLWYRSRPVCLGRHPDGGHRPGLDRPGAQGR
jgi:acetylornithine deacetylase